MPALQVEWSHAARPHPAELEPGDRCLVKIHPGGVLFAVVDGLGHGKDAIIAAGAAVRALSEAPGEPLAAQFQRCHQALRGTRGAALAVAVLDERTGLLTWAGVGNVAGSLLRAPPATPPRESLRSVAGVVGYRMEAVRPSWHTIGEGDLLVFATDGIRPGFEEAVELAWPPERIATRILARYRVEADDALVFAARFLPQADSAPSPGARA